MAGGYSNSIESGSSSSSSTPVSVSSPQSDFALSVAQDALALADSQAQWAAGVWASTSAITDAAINQLTQQETQQANLATQNINQYINTFAPINNALVNAANTYASSGFQAQ